MSVTASGFVWKSVWVGTAASFAWDWRESGSCGGGGWAVGTGGSVCAWGHGGTGAWVVFVAHVSVESVPAGERHVHNVVGQEDENLSDEDGVDVARFYGAVVSGVGGGASGGVIGRVVNYLWICEVGDNINVIDVVALHSVKKTLKTCPLFKIRFFRFFNNLFSKVHGGLVTVLIKKSRKCVKKNIFKRKYNHGRQPWSK